MKYALSVISFVIVALFMATSTVTMTGCSEVLGVGDTIRDTVSLEKLSVPTVDSVEVLAGGDSAKIHYSGSFVAKEKFCGVYLLSGNTTAAAVVAKDSVSDGGVTWNSKGAFKVKIVRDGAQSFWIAAFNKSQDRSQAVPAIVYGRVIAGAIVSRFTVPVTGNDGIDVDGVPAVKNVESGIRADANPVKYATNTGADMIVEQITSTGTLCITPIGGAVIFKTDSTKIFTKAQIDAIYTQSYNKDSITLATYGIKTFAQGLSVRDAAVLHPLAVGEFYIVITSAKNIARVRVETVTGATSATLKIYQDSGRNAGEPLYKKAL